MSEVTKEVGTTTVDQIVSGVKSDTKSSHTCIELPTGYIDQDGNLQKAVDIRPYTGEEEDILASQKMPMYRRLGKLLENCVTRIGDIDDPKRLKSIIRQLVFSDRLFLIVQVRAATNGNIYSLDVKCPEEDCGLNSMQHIDLADIKWVGLQDPMKRQYSFKLPGSGVDVTWNVMDGIREERIHQHSLDRDLLSVGILARLNDLDTRRVTMAMVKKMTPPQRRALRKEFEKAEGTLDDQVTFECKHCGHEWTDSVDYAQPSFFFPTDE